VAPFSSEPRSGAHLMRLLIGRAQVTRRLAVAMAMSMQRRQTLHARARLPRQR
jgi:hypothetical protein